MASPVLTDPTAPSTDTRRRWQRSWYFYDWANSAYVTTSASVLVGPYLTALAKADACPGLPSEEVCTASLDVLGVPIAAGSLAPYTVTVSTVLSAVVLLVVGAAADRSAHPTRLFGVFAWIGAAAASAMFFLSGTSWQLGVALLVVANVCLGASLVVYDALLVRIAEPDERDRVSSRGWALGYLGGGLLLAANLALMTLHSSLGLSTGMAVRISLLSAGLWWALFTLIPVLGLRDVRRSELMPASARMGTVRRLGATLASLRLYPQTCLFLAAYLLFNDGIQTVIGNSSLYGQEALGFSQQQMMMTFLLVQFVAFGGALAFGRLAGRVGARRSILGGLALWLLAVGFAYFVPRGAFGLWLGCAVLIGVVMGGTQALSRSLYSQFTPPGRESEYFAFYQAAERGTSWFGTLMFGLVFQATHSYRSAILGTMAFFVVGGALLAMVRVREGIISAGNVPPAVV